jgi:cysteine synthase A
MRAAALAVPRFEVATDEREVDRAVAAVGVPCVVKPVDDSGSNNVVLCHDAATARRHARIVLGTRANVRGQAHAGAVLVEEYVAGPEYSVEMFSNDGVLACLGVTAKTTMAEPYFVECRHEFPARLPDAARDEIVAAVRAVLAATGITWGVTHTEVRLSPAGPVVMEVNARPAGGMIPELIRLATGVDIVEQHLRVLGGLPVDLEQVRAKHAGIAFLTAQREGRLEGVAGTGAAAAVPAVEQVVVTARPGATVRPPRSAYDRLGYVIAAADSPERVRTALATALTRLTVAVAP